MAGKGSLIPGPASRYRLLRPWVEERDGSTRKHGGIGAKVELFLPSESELNHSFPSAEQKHESLFTIP